MDANLRPDLTRILPRPLTRQLHVGLGAALRLPDAARGQDYLVDVERDRAPGPDDVGFGLEQARAVAARVAQRLPGVSPGALHPLQPDRAHGLLS